MPERRPLPTELMGFRTGDGSGPLSRLLIDKSVSPAFRGPKGMPLHTADALLAAARKEGLLLGFEIACVAAALEQWSARAQHDCS